MSLDSYFFCTFAADMKKGILKNQEKGLSKCELEGDGRISCGRDECVNQ